MSSSRETLESLDWPWEEQWWKPKTLGRDNRRAGALFLAEIERCNRALEAMNPEVRDSADMEEVETLQRQRETARRGLNMAEYAYNTALEEDTFDFATDRAPVPRPKPPVAVV